MVAVGHAGRQLPSGSGWRRPSACCCTRLRSRPGLRSGELRTLTRGKLFLAADSPYVTCRAGSTKNKKDARQYIKPDLAAGLKQHVANKAPQAPVFAMPHEADVAAMLREDAAEARREWIQAAKGDAEEMLRRNEGDFLADANDEGERLDFHSLRHTCGAWLAMTGAHPKAVQVIMRHSTIVLTMDTYGHLLPGQEADTVAKLPSMMGDGPKPLRATGTLGKGHDAAGIAQRVAQRARRENPTRDDATQCEKTTERDESEGNLNPFPVARCDDEAPLNASDCESTPGRNRTCNLRIRSPLLYPVELRAQTDRSPNTPR